MNEASPQSLERRVEPSRARREARNVELVSNMNDLRTGQLMDEILRADKCLGFLTPGKQLVLIERNQAYLEEIMGKIVGELCPNHILTFEDYHRPHHLVYGEKIQVYNNLEAASPVLMMLARMKGTDSTTEKVGRKSEETVKLFGYKTVKRGTIAEAHNPHKTRIGDMQGAKVIVSRPEDVAEVVRRLLMLPFLRLEKYEEKSEENGYTSTHLNVIYSNGNPLMRGLELEIQVTDLQSHIDSETKPEQSHDLGYGAKKLASSHHLDGQLVMYGNSVKVDRNMCEVRRFEGLNVVLVPNPILPYVLVDPKEC